MKPLPLKATRLSLKLALSLEYIRFKRYNRYGGETTKLS